MSLHASARLTLLATSAIVLLVLLWATGASSAPAASNNGLLVFGSDRPDGLNAASDVYTMAADGSNVAQVTLRGGSEPAWNADGTRIAFSTQFSYDGTSTSEAIYAMNPDGSAKTLVVDSDPSNVTNACTLNRHPSWSPDGTRIAVQMNACYVNGQPVQGGIFVVELATGAVTRLTSNRDGFGEDGYPAWSHDGTKIAFARQDSAGYQIFVMDTEGGNLIQLTSTVLSTNTHPAWSPDDSQIAFASSRDGNYEIWVMDADGGNPVQLTVTDNGLGVINSYPDWSPDGTRIAFASNHPGGPGDYEIYVMNADGSSQTRITDNDANDLRPGWQPGGGSPPPPAPGTIVIALDAVPDDAQDFSFSGNGAPSSGGASEIILSFPLDDDADATLASSRTLADRGAGSYTIRQNAVPAGWNLTGLTCADPDAGSSTDLAAATATIDLDPGETVTCTFTNSDTTQPTLTLPGDLSADATSPTGATVAYTATASDLVDPSPTVSCAPSSGSVFPIGTTTVNCTATDEAGNSAAGSFTIYVRGAGEQITALIAKTRAFLDAPALEAGLTATLRVAATALAAGRKPVACTALSVYIVVVRATPTRLLTSAKKSELVADATRIRTVIGC